MAAATRRRMRGLVRDSKIAATSVVAAGQPRSVIACGVASASRVHAMPIRRTRSGLIGVVTRGLLMAWVRVTHACDARIDAWRERFNWMINL